LSTASDSPVSIDSSICSPRAHDARIGRHLVAGAQHEDVGEHDGRRDVLLHGVASRTRLRGVQQRELVEGGLARNSCTEPMTALATAAKPKRASCQRPRANRMPKHAKTMPLNSVKTLARMMLSALRLVSAR
jgi:hypothetical protein